jgi:hypothetical protein
VDLIVGRQKGDVTEMDVFELADELGMEISKRQAKSMIKAAKKAYGY